AKSTLCAHRPRQRPSTPTLASTLSARTNAWGRTAPFPHWALRPSLLKRAQTKQTPCSWEWPAKRTTATRAPASTLAKTVRGAATSIPPALSCTVFAKKPPPPPRPSTQLPPLATLSPPRLSRQKKSPHSTLQVRKTP